MDLDLSDDQQLFRDTTQRFLAERCPATAVRALLDDDLGVDTDLLARGAELGWTSMLVPDGYGGGSISGAGVRDAAIVAELLGRHLVAGPVLPTNVVADAVARDGAGALTAEVLPGLASGERRVTWTGPSAVAATRSADGVRLEGVATPVPDAHVSDHLLVSAADGTRALVATDAPGVTVDVLDGLDLTRRYATVRLEGVQVGAGAVLRDGDGGRQLALALTLQCAETVGATDAAYTMTLAFVRERKAFGRPIGSYQALKHRLADMLLWLESAKAATSEAVRAVQEDEAGALDAARVAKAYVAERCPALVRDCLQLHGGIGFTWEHDVHLFLRRVDTNAAVLGGVAEQLDALAPAIGFCPMGS